MDYWGNKIDISKEAAKRQVSIITSFPSEKRFKIALDFANMGIAQTHKWIRETHPEYSDLEIRLEFVRLIYYETGEMSEDHWQHFKKSMETLIRKDWTERFRNMMKAKNWTYDHIAKYGRFKNGKVVEATVSRNLPSFAKLAVVLYEQGNKNVL